MKKKIMIIGLLLALLLLVGCQGNFTILQPKNPRPATQEVGNPADTQAPEEVGGEETAPAETAPKETIPPDGDPGNVTCKGSYTGSVNADTVVATVGEESLTLGVLQAYYWAEAAQYRSGGAEEMPDFSRPLDSQVCTVDGTVYSWQQYFLKKALNTWHTAQALNQVSKVDPLYRDDRYNPRTENYEEYMKGMPVLPLVYGYSTEYRPNSMHQAFLDALPQYLEELAQARGFEDGEAMAREAFGASLEDLKTFSDLYNRGYMYLTYRSYYLDTTQEKAEAEYNQDHTGEKEKLVDLRHILLAPGAEEEAQKLDEQWQEDKKGRECDFAEVANRYSLDSCTSGDGGAYYRIEKGQMPEQIDSWCFDDERKPGDHTVISLDDGVHLIYFVSSQERWQAKALDEKKVRLQQDLIREAKERFPMEVTYSAICLGQGQGTVAAEELLYPDIAHERYPEVPLYIQQDYLGTMYGNYPVHITGCGISVLSMLASYMLDEELTVPTMCDRFGARYSTASGTDGMMFIYEPKTMGFYLIKKSDNAEEAYQALQDGYMVVNLQHKGYWTGGGHYILLEKLTEDGSVQVRDTTVYNYGRIKGHLEDKHSWSSIVQASAGYWIFDRKVTRISLCSRCGDPAEAQGGLVEDYICHKCRTALLRREAYLTAG